MFDALVVQPIFNLLLVIYSLIPGGDFGIAIIIFTIIVRFLMYPLIKKQLYQTKAMRRLQPELARVKKQAKGNRQLEGMMMMELYKKHGVSPFRSIGILLIQLPIFFALYYVIQIFTVHRDQIAKFAYDFLEGIGPIKQLIDNPHGFNEKMLGIVDLTKPAFNSNGVDIILVILAIVAAYTQYIMSKQTMPMQPEKKKSFSQMMSEAAAGKQVDQSEMNAAMMGNMTKILPFFMLVIMLSLPGALALYYVMSNIVAVVQQDRLLKQDETELEAMIDEVKEKPQSSKKSTVSSRVKTAKEAKITKITAKDTKRKGR